MHIPNLVLIPKTLHVTALSFETETMTIHARTFSVAARCPVCGRGSSRLHNRYTRTLSDLSCRDPRPFPNRRPPIPL
jgi:hypothetical protein